MLSSVGMAFFPTVIYGKPAVVYPSSDIALSESHAVHGTTLRASKFSQTVEDTDTWLEAHLAALGAPGGAWCVVRGGRVVHPRDLVMLTRRAK